MLRYIDSTPIFTREAPSLTYSEHLTSQTLQATFFFEPKRQNLSPPRRAIRYAAMPRECHPMCLPPATVRWLHWDGRPRCKHRGVVCKAIRACSRCVYRRLLCGGCTGTGALDVNIEGLYARRSEHIPDVPDGSTAGYCAAVALGRAPSM